LGVVVGAPLAAGGAAIAGASAGVAALVGTAAGTIISVGGFFTSWASNQSSGSSGRVKFRIFNAHKKNLMITKCYLKSFGIATSVILIL